MNVQMDKTIDVNAAIEFAKHSNGTPTQSPKDDPNNLDNYKHGQIIIKDGIPGIVIDREEKLRTIAKNDPELNMMKDLMDPNDPTFSKLDPDIAKPEGTQEALDRYLKEHEDVRLKRDEVRYAFAGYEIGGNGMLVPKDDPRARTYAEAMAKVRSGEIRLPTVEEYEKQEQEARRRNAEMANSRMAEQSRQANTTDQSQQQPITSSTKPEEPRQAQIPKNNDKMEEMSMSVEERQQVIKTAKADPMMTAIAAQSAKAEKVEDKPETNDVQVTEESNEQEPKLADSPINLFAAKEQLDAITHAEQEIQYVAPEQNDVQASVTINVPAEKADGFVDSLKSRTAAKIETAQKIKVNFTTEINLPKAAKRITDIDGYRRVAPKNVSVDITPRVLINSGYIGYFKPCGALKWSRLAPPINEDGEFEDMDEGRIIQFCYEQLATTSIGNMSYREFLENTSAEDIPAMLHAIMGASLPDQQDVILTCGKCGEEFESTYSIAELPDYETMAEDTKQQAVLVESVKDIEDDAKDIHDESPVMRRLSYTADSTESIFVFKHTDLAMTVDRQPVVQYLVDRYGTSAALLSTVIEEVYIKIGDTSTADDWSISNDPTVICEELLRLNKENLDEVKAVVEEIPMIAPITYSFKQTRVCNKCGTKLTRLTQNIRTLVFQIALKARYFV